MVETEAALGLSVAPPLVAALIAVLRPLLRRFLPADAIPPIAVVVGVGYTLLAWYGDVVEAENIIVAGLLGLTVGIGAVGTREIWRNYTEPPTQS